MCSLGVYGVHAWNSRNNNIEVDHFKGGYLSSENFLTFCWLLIFTLFYIYSFFEITKEAHAL